MNINIKNIKKIIAVILLALLVISVSVSCSAGGGDNKNDGDADNFGDSTENQDEAKQTTERIYPDLKEQDFGGYEFRILARTTSQIDWDKWKHRDIYAEQENGDPINDAIYKRTGEIYDTYGIKLKQINSDDIVNDLSKSVRAGTDDYQGLWCWQSQIAQLSTRNALVNLYDVPNLDVSNEWWDQKSIEAFSMGDKLYFVTGELSINAKHDTNAVLFNKKIFNDLAIEYPYKMVYENKWTLDNYISLSKQFSKDLDGDGVRTSKDAYGFIGQWANLYTYMVGCGITAVGKDENNYPVLSLYSERAVNVFDKISEVMYDDTIMINPVQSKVLDEYGGDSIGVWTASREEWFAGNRLLFYMAGIGCVEELRNMESPFGVLPMPKYDENQKEYHSETSQFCTAVGIAATNGNLEAAGYTLEAMSALSCNELKAAYYDNLLRRKILRDDESEGMLDVIFSARSYDISMVYDIGGFMGMFVELGNKKSKDFTSAYEKKEAAAVKQLDKLIETYKTMGE